MSAPTVSFITVSVSHWIDFSRRSLYISLLSIAANPLLWNIIGRNEYKNRTLSRRFGARISSTVLGISIFVAGLLRDVLYRIAIHDQPRYPLPYAVQTLLAWCLFGLGNALVGASYLRLGFYGTFCGDYFGILQTKRVTGFPYNVLDNPMYVGATLCFVGAALWYERPAGLLLALYVHITYAVALRFEEPFTRMIYGGREKME